MFALILISMISFSCEIGYNYKLSQQTARSKPVQFTPALYYRLILGAILSVIFFIIWAFLISEQNQLIKETELINGNELILKQLLSQKRNLYCYFGLMEVCILMRITIGLVFYLSLNRQDIYDVIKIISYLSFLFDLSIMIYSLFYTVKEASKVQ